MERTHEYGAYIIHSLETGQPRVVYGNVANDHLIDNLPQGACVEVPCLVDRNGIQPTRVGALPPMSGSTMAGLPYTSSAARIDSCTKGWSGSVRAGFTPAR